MIIGGRLGYILFYNLGFYLENPLKLLAVWEGGMSFHGGALGVIFVGWRFCTKHAVSFWQVADATAPIGTIGLALGRLGNFINGELYGRLLTCPGELSFLEVVISLGIPPSYMRCFLKG